MCATAPMTSQPENQENDWVDADHSGVSDDQWHRHTGETPPEHAHGVTAPRNIFLIGVACFLFVVACVAAITQYFVMGSQEEIEAKQEVSLGAGFADTKASWDAKLHEYDWLDAPNGVVSVPIETAIDNVVREYSQTK